MSGMIAACLGVLLAAGAASAASVPLQYVDDITPLTTWCALRAIKVHDDGAGVLSGMLTLAGVEHEVRVAPLEDGAVALAADLDGDGTASPIDWEGTLADGALLGSPEFVLAATDNQTASYRVFLMWSPLVPGMVTYCRDNYRLGTFEAAKRSVLLAVVDDNTDGTFDDEGGTLFVDVDGDGRLLTDVDSHERFRLSEPFVLDGITYVATSVAADGTQAEIEIAAEPAEPKPPLLVGYPAPGFRSGDPQAGSMGMDSLRGKIVLLDFWAGWCQPCLAELPNVAALAEAFRERGVEVVGINLDRSRAAFDEIVALSPLTYPQIYDGPDGPIASLYRIVGIPMTYLIDRSGIIRARNLQGDELVAAVLALLDEESES
jgi:thiol-disulfide isomerase/thioredoxin